MRGSIQSGMSREFDKKLMASSLNYISFLAEQQVESDRLGDKKWDELSDKNYMANQLYLVVSSQLIEYIHLMGSTTPLSAYSTEIFLQ